MTIRYETTPTTKNDMGSPVTKPATKHELAEATREPSSGRSQPHSTATTTPVGAARSAAPPAAASITGARTCGSERDPEKRSEGMSHRSRSNSEESDVEVKQRFSTPVTDSDNRQYRSRIRHHDNGDVQSRLRTTRR